MLTAFYLVRLPALALALLLCGVAFAQPAGLVITQEEIARVRLAQQALAPAPADIPAATLTALREKIVGYPVTARNATLWEATARREDFAATLPDLLPHIYHGRLCLRADELAKRPLTAVEQRRCGVIAGTETLPAPAQAGGKLIAVAPTEAMLAQWTPELLSDLARHADYFILPAAGWGGQEPAQATFRRQVRYYAAMIRAAHPQCRILVAVKAPVADEKASAALLRALAGLQTTAPASFDGVYLDLAASPALSQLVAWLRPTAARPAAACYVQRAGRLILDGEGRPMQLRGMNLSGWLSWEGWLMGGGQLAESTIDARLRQLLGDAEAERFRAAYADTFIGEADIARIAKLGYNVVRVPINHRILATLRGNGTDGWPLLDRLLDWCEQYHVYVILDLQAAPGGQSPLFTADPTAGGSLWTSPARKAETVALWKRIAQRYRDRTIVAGYDLLNEPIPSDSHALLGLYRQLVSAIRAVDPYHLLILEGSNRSRDLSLFAESLTVNQLLSFHLHQPNAAARQQLLSAYAKQSEAQHMPVWNGEFGEDGYEIVKGALVALTDPRYGIAGQCFWNWKMAPNVHPGLQLVQVSPGWIAVVAWMSLPEKYPQPTHAAALAAAHEYLTALPLANCIEDRWMAQVLAMVQ